MPRSTIRNLPLDTLTAPPVIEPDPCFPEESTQAVFTDAQLANDMQNNTKTKFRIFHQMIAVQKQIKLPKISIP
ncbi:hypothetical protein RvVAR0630_05150 [Agrobacterium vitis]|nr:hypothetical protein RvVAR0630_05150 [Agrobacterium vitis]